MATRASPPRHTRRRAYRDPSSIAVPVAAFGQQAPQRGDPTVALRVALRDGAETTVHVAAYALEEFEPKLVLMRAPEPLVTWCRRSGVADAVVGGFFVRHRGGTPLGEVRTGGMRRRSVAFAEPWSARRSCVHVESGQLRLAARADLPAEPRGDLLQAGPMLVRDGRSVIRQGVDPEGFSAGQGQFDSDITAGRYPRAALGVRDGIVWALACDGRAAGDCGMTLAELAGAMVRLGAADAINLDGGGSTSLVCGGSLVNHPREEHGVELPGGRPISTALAFVPRA